MRMFKEHLFLLLILYIRNSSCVVDAIYDIDRAIWKLHLIIDEITSHSSNTVNRVLTENSVRDKEMKNQMDEINKQLDRMEEFINPKIIHDLFDPWPFGPLLYKIIDTVEIFVISIDEYYKDFRQHINESSYNSDTVRGYLRSIVPNIQDRIYAIRKNVIDENEFLPGHQNLVYAMTGRAIVLQPQFCSATRIISHFLVQLFGMVMAAEMKANIMLAIERVNQYPQALGWLEICSKEHLDRQFRIYVDIFSVNIQMTDGIYLRACDPRGYNWIRDESFHELEGTVQTAIFHYDSTKCNHESCYDAWFQKAQICDAHYYDARSGCPGTLTECTSLKTVQACVLKSGPYKFQYVNSSDLGLLGENSECPRDDGYIIGDGTSENSANTTCACNCHGNNSRISLFLIESLVEWNMVITGVRFIRQNQILHIQPRAGKLGANGHVFRFGQRWIPIPKHIPEYQIRSINERNKIFFLDDVHLPPGFIVTGVKFNEVVRGNVAGFAIEIYGIPFDYKTGKLNLDSKFSTSKEASYDDPGKPLSFVAISSVHGHVPHTPSPQSIKYVTLERSELQEDFGQSTLPLFDAVPVTIDYPTVLGGMGIFHKGAEGYAGLISLRVFGISYAKYFTDFQSIFMINDTMTLRIE